MWYFCYLLTPFTEPIIDMLWIILIVTFVQTFNMFLEPFINLFHIISWINPPNTYKIQVLLRLCLQDALYHRCKVCSIYKYQKYINRDNFLHFLLYAKIVGISKWLSCHPSSRPYQMHPMSSGQTLASQAWICSNRAVLCLGTKYFLH